MFRTPGPPAVGDPGVAVSGAHVCARCPKMLGLSCCETRPGEKLATLTRDDLERLGEATGRARASFCDEEWLSADEAAAWADAHLLYRGYFAAGPKRYTLKTQPNGACVFHRAATGCSLSAEQRPTACRLYPFEPRADGSWALTPERFGSVAEARAAAAEGALACLAVEEADSFETLRAAMQVSREEVEALAERLRDEVQRHARAERRGAK